MWISVHVLWFSNLQAFFFGKSEQSVLKPPRRGFSVKRSETVERFGSEWRLEMINAEVRGRGINADVLICLCVCVHVIKMWVDAKSKNQFENDATSQLHHCLSINQ